MIRAGGWRPAARRLLGLPRLPTGLVGVDHLSRDWTFRHSRPSPASMLGRWRTRRAAVAAPPVRVFRPVSPRARWIGYFVYLPSGGLTAAHRFTLRRLREGQDSGLMVICAAPTPAAVPAELHALVDALYWKGLGGFDFSAYAVAIDAVAADSPGADLLLLNDSVFGPFGSADALWGAARWDLTGFTAAGAGENHIQSYGFILRALDPARAAALRPVFPPGRAFDDFATVLLHQEMRLAVVAARSMSVGATWYADPDECADPSLFAALPLVEAGFPFLKRALLGKHRGIYPDKDVLDTLRRMGHPLPDSAA